MDDFGYKSLPIDVSQLCLQELINCGKTRTYQTCYDIDQIHVELFTGETSVKVTEWNSGCEKTL